MCFYSLHKDYSDNGDKIEEGRENIKFFSNLFFAWFELLLLHDRSNVEQIKDFFSSGIDNRKDMC